MADIQMCRKRIYEAFASNDIWFDLCRNDPWATTFTSDNFDVLLCCPTSMRVALRPAAGAHSRLYDRYVTMPSKTETAELKADGLVREYAIEMSQIEFDDFHAVRAIRDVSEREFVGGHPFCVDVLIPEPDS